MRFSSYTLGRAIDDVERLRASGEIQYNRGWVGCCPRYFLIFPNDEHKYYYNPNKLISESLKKKVFKYLYRPSYNNMSKSSNSKSMVKQKNSYVHSLVDDFKKVHNNTTKSVKIDLTKIKLGEAVKLIKQNIHDKKLAFELPDNKLYILNDNTMEKLQKGLIYETEEYAIRNSISDAELFSIAIQYT